MKASTNDRAQHTQAADGVSQAGLDARLEPLRQLVSARLDALLTPLEDCPPVLTEAMRYSVLAGGKRLRPILVLLAAEACGAPSEEALPAACAVELVHTYSLIHDDLPAMDDDDLRRGRPTNHKVFGEGMAVLAGDALLTLAFEVLAQNLQPDIAARTVRELAAAAGRCGMVGGQADDLLESREPRAERRPGPEIPTLDSRVSTVESIHRRKTGALLRACLRLGGMVAGADRETLTALDHYGAAVGLAFQIADDLLDAHGNEGEVGKRVQKDAERGKLTFPALVGSEASRQQARQLVQEAVAALAPLRQRGETLAALAHWIVERIR